MVKKTEKRLAWALMIMLYGSWVASLFYGGYLKWFDKRESLCNYTWEEVSE